MEAPSLVLVPPTPSRSELPSLTSSPSLSVASSSQFTEFELVDTVNLSGQRHSSETAIVSIYSMYGDDDSRASWQPEDGKNSLPRVNISSVASDTSYYTDEDSELAYFTPPISGNGHLFSKAPPARLTQLTQAAMITANGRPRSSYTPQTYVDITETRRASTGHSLSMRTSERTSLSLPPVSRSEESSTSPSRYSKYQSERFSQTSKSDIPPAPSISTLSPTPQTPEHLSVPGASSNPSSPSLPLKHPPYVHSPSSKSSLVPSEGEDLDAFHVRNTYAQLDISGVKGDGYEEGVERTRARVGASRASQLCAEGAIGDGTEKSRELDPKELETLATVDRYGFITASSHDRLVLLPSAPLQKRFSRSAAGPPSTSTSAPSLKSLPPTVPPLKETSRIEKWTRMLEPQSRDPGGNIQSWGVRSSKEAKLRSRTYKGIPDRWRHAAWELLMSRFSRSHSLAQLCVEYREALDKPSSYDIQIDLDVPRTISGHIMFRTRYGAGQRSLFRVLHSFSLRCPDCGYVQGMGPIAATLLCYFDSERTYASLVRLHDAYNMHAIFSPGFPGLLEAIYIQERLTEEMMPGVFAAFRKHMISTTSYATKWYITLFANTVPFQLQLRLWDVFLLEGQDLFVAMAVGIVWVYRDLITSNSANFETILSLLSSFFVPENEDALLQWIRTTLEDKKIRSSMRKWRNDWKALVAAGKDGNALL